MTIWQTILQAIMLTRWFHRSKVVEEGLDDFIDRVQDALFTSDKSQLRNLQRYARRHDDPEYLRAIRDKQRLHDQLQTPAGDSRWGRWAIQFLLAWLHRKLSSRPVGEALLVAALVFGLIFAFDHVKSWLSIEYRTGGADLRQEPEPIRLENENDGRAKDQDAAEKILQEEVPAHVEKYLRTRTFQQSLRDQIRAALEEDRQSSPSDLE